jgi:hypothetical protein
MLFLCKQSLHTIDIGHDPDPNDFKKSDADPDKHRQYPQHCLQATCSNIYIFTCSVFFYTVANVEPKYSKDLFIFLKNVKIEIEERKIPWLNCGRKLNFVLKYSIH